MYADDDQSVAEGRPGLDAEFEDDDVEESEADYRARLMQVDTFLRLNETINSLQEVSRDKPEYGREVQKILQSSRSHARFDANGGVRDESTTGVRTADSGACGGDHVKRFDEVRGDETVEIKTHAHIIYHGDLLQFSKETVTLVVSKRDMTLFTRIIDCFRCMIMGTHTEGMVGEMRRDYDALVEMWNDAPNGSEELNIGAELNNMVRSMLDTPLYYSNSCLSIIASGQMLRKLYAATEGEECESYERLLGFVRAHMRHNAVDPFACDCEGGGCGCSRECKTLMSMIMEVPNVVHNQTYVLQILAYILYNKAGREEVFVNNLKNTCSPGLLDKVPTRVSLLMGTLEESGIRRIFRTIRKRTKHLNPLRGDRAAYTKFALEKLVRSAQHPQIRALIESLPGAAAATVELRLPKCAAGKRQCLNREFDEKTIARRESNNDGKNKCCGYLRQDPFDMLVSSVALTQILVYLFTDPLSGSTESRKHFFVRDIIVAMAKQSVKIEIETLEEMFRYLDRTRVFKSFSEHPLLMSALHELFTTYIDSMKDVAKKYKEAGKKRRIKRYMQKSGFPEGML